MKRRNTPQSKLTEEEAATLQFWVAEMRLGEELKLFGHRVYIDSMLEIGRILKSAEQRRISEGGVNG